MEIATPVGILLSVVFIAVAFIIEGGSPMVAFSNPAAIIIIIGGTVGVGMASNKMSDIGGGIKATLKMLKPGTKLDGAAAVNELMGYADIARRDGLLALEEKAKAVEDPFLKRGLELVIDGTDSDDVESTLSDEVEAQSVRHKVAAKFFSDLGAFAPTLGILGTVLGLVHALESVEDVNKMVHAISAAFLATLWGVMTANLVYLPISNKLKRLATIESTHRHLLIQGVLAIQAGSSPRAVGDRLASHLPPSERGGVNEPGQEQLSA